MPHLYTDEQIEWLKLHKPHLSQKEVQTQFNATFNTNISKAAINLFATRRGFVSLNDTKYQKGHTPWSKNRKGLNPNSGSFQPGQIAKCSELGTERINDKGYIEVKTQNLPAKWTLKQRHIWEQANRTLMANERVIFLDGDKRNFSLDNLTVLKASELATLNRHENFSQQPIEIKKALIGIVRLEQTVRVRLEYENS